VAFEKPYFRLMAFRRTSQSSVTPDWRSAVRKLSIEYPSSPIVTTPGALSMRPAASTRSSAA
jgi:hypothetical protein